MNYYPRIMISILLAFSGFYWNSSVPRIIGEAFRTVADRVFALRAGRALCTATATGFTVAAPDTKVAGQPACVQRRWETPRQPRKQAKARAREVLVEDTRRRFCDGVYNQCLRKRARTTKERTGGKGCGPGERRFL